MAEDANEQKDCAADGAKRLAKKFLAEKALRLVARCRLLVGGPMMFRVPRPSASQRRVADNRLAGFYIPRRAMIPVTSRVAC